MKKMICILLVLLVGCSKTETSESIEEIVEDEIEVVELPEVEMTYLGHAGICFKMDDFVMYVDPFGPIESELPADVILVTHDHYDHNAVQYCAKKDECTIITNNEALVNGEYQSFDKTVKIEAVPAGNNPNHDINKCVGYVLTFPNEVKVYISGDTSKIDSMSDLNDIDYAFYCCDGVYNMDVNEALECAQMVNASYDIPYHTCPLEQGLYDETVALAFNSNNRLLVEPLGGIILEKNN